MAYKASSNHRLALYPSLLQSDTKCYLFACKHFPDYNKSYHKSQSGQSFTNIRALKVMNICQIITIHLNENKNDGKKTVVTVEPGTGSNIYSCPNP